MAVEVGGERGVASARRFLVGVLLVRPSRTRLLVSVALVYGRDIHQ